MQHLFCQKKLLGLLEEEREKGKEAIATAVAEQNASSKVSCIHLGYPDLGNLLKAPIHVYLDTYEIFT